MFKRRIFSSCFSLSKGLFSQKRTIVTLLCLIIFLTSLYFAVYFKKQAVSKVAEANKQEILMQWEGSWEIGLDLTRLVRDYNFTVPKEIDWDLVDTYNPHYLANADDTIEFTGYGYAFKNKRLKIKRQGHHQRKDKNDKFQSLLMSYLHTEDQIVKYAHGSLINLGPKGELTLGSELAYSKSEPPVGSLSFLIKRLGLESSYANSEISKIDYEKSKSALVKQEFAFAMQLLIGVAAMQASQQDIERDLAEVKKELTDLKETVSRSIAAKAHYPPEFWIAVATAVCSWFVMLYNLIFSWLKEQRERRKEKQEDATVSVYSEADLQKVIAESYLSTRLKK